MREMDLDRRGFLEASGKAAGAVVVASGGVTMLMGADHAWAVPLEALDGATAQTLLRAIRLIYPHDALGDQYYAVVIEALDADAKADPATAELLQAGVAGLDQALPVPFLELSEGYQLRLLQTLESTPFFQAIRGKTIGVLYNQPGVWQAFGYEGPSADEGGYIDRGFDDLGWLPDPPEDASPAKA